MNIDGSFVKEITSLANQACSDRVHTKAIGADRRRYLLVKADGSHEFEDVPPEYRDHKATRINDLATLQKTISPDDDADAVDDNGIGTAGVFYDQTAIVLVFDHNDGRDRATMKLNTPAVFDVVQKMAERGDRLDQKGLIELLTFTFHGALIERSLIDVVRKINFVANQQATGVVGETATAIDRSITAELTGAGEIPDHFYVKTPVFSNPGIDHETGIKLRLACNPDDQTFMVRPYPGEIEAAIDNALDQVAEQIAAELPDVLAVRGSFDERLNSGLNNDE